MGVSIGSDSLAATAANMYSNNAKTDSMEATLKNSNASDADLLKACKSFESYMLEQVFKGMESTVDKSEEEENNDYLNQFSDKLYEEYADEASKNQSVGIAQMLYESMKRNS